LKQTSSLLLVNDSVLKGRGEVEYIHVDYRPGRGNVFLVRGRDVFKVEMSAPPRGTRRQYMGEEDGSPVRVRDACVRGTAPP